ncbi:hypothetical protein [Actinocorallia sp. A-T 12471]|uniref:DUF7144 family membrane protein n=1 Tax=Actinocorallia sp. A-T 12471 TaxID=3089813 RepID=UPI0029CF8233|nr:hypothetical protein [Actinocorallia sp. A-T 12471]MDX6744980.1 hypothetical protein [Actinocorallia sp. A-T 12471]
MSTSTTRQAAATGFVLFVAILMILNGVWGIIVGLAALIKQEFFVVAPNYIYQFSLTGWGWIHLLLGILIVAVAFALIAGQSWARWPVIILALLQAIAQFFFLPYYPWWSILIIILDIIIIWSLLTYTPKPL